ncbi:Rossmann-like and DUF2520 domain-containing protein [Pontibacter harenae]|uniref:Rossmann-like and DUF2520 domain-containing protein n=1 Tax=Pontibacter harenae TaxID=2894083 RepID=UPI001E2C58F8|nr:Rossmann-like and DUF2520 domain-containing protein [Pontibacter harenae]MCC9167766.1 DUF2520 domain-containing protein [Pontibacter harenae]
MKIALIGAGNVAWHLSKALKAANHQIVAVYSRSEASRKELLNQLPLAKELHSLNLTELEVELVLIAVPDAAIATVATQLQVKSGTVVAHTSGSQPMAVLESIPNASLGVFYPLQTFSKHKPVDFKEVPLLVEAQNIKTLERLRLVAQSISQKVEEVNSTARKQLHLAAVFACNFTNHLLGISRELLQEADLPEGLLQPLIQETVAKAAQHDPFTVQTGPAVRHDNNVLEEHLQALQSHPTYQLLYQQLSRSIQDKTIDARNK